MTEVLETTPPTQTPSQEDKETFIRRVRILPLLKNDTDSLGAPRKATRLGMDEATAMEFVNAPGVKKHLADTGHSILMVPEATRTQGAFSPVQVEIVPPMSTEELHELARLSVQGVLVEGWAPNKVNPPIGGVEFTDFTRALPDSEVDRGGWNERIASSLDYQQPAHLSLSTLPDNLTPRARTDLYLSA